MAPDTNAMAVSATLHCLTGCAIGEIAGLMIGTALAPRIGYDLAAEIAKTAAKSGRTIREVARELTDLSDEELDTLLDPAGMTEPGTTLGSAGG